MAGRIENLLYYMNIEYNTIGYYVVYVIFDPSKNEFSIYAHLHVSFLLFLTQQEQRTFLYMNWLYLRGFGVFLGVFFDI